MKYLFLGEFLLLAKQNTKSLGELLFLAVPNTKCLGLGYVSLQVNCLLCLWHAFTLLANRTQAVYYWVAV